MPIDKAIQPDDVEPLIQALTRITAGDFGVRLEVPTDDRPLDVLAAAINTTAEELAETRRELARHQADLESAVRDRTQELEAINARLVEEVEERKSIEASLRDREEKYRLLAENASPVAVSFRVVVVLVPSTNS